MLCNTDHIITSKLILPKLEALLSVRLCITLAPKKLHLRRKSWARFLTDRPLCLPGWSRHKGQRRIMKHVCTNMRTHRWTSVTLMTLCSTTESNHSMNDSTVAFFLSSSFSSWKTVMESSGKKQKISQEETSFKFSVSILQIFWHFSA